MQNINYKMQNIKYKKQRFCETKKQFEGIGQICDFALKKKWDKDRLMIDQYLYFEEYTLCPFFCEADLRDFDFDFFEGSSCCIPGGYIPFCSCP